MSDELVGQVLGDYEILNVVGRGGMGVVYEAKRRSDGATVALKIPHDYLAAEQGYLRRFYQEARVAAKVRHSNIVATYDIGNDGPYHYIAMEFVRGRPLSQAIKNGDIKVAAALEIIRQIASALGDVHSQNIVHRDIKPENIILEFSGAPKMTDFGIARVIDLGAARPRTRDLERTKGEWAGTPHYASPEQILRMRTDHRTDIYSLGVVLFEMLTGRLPFHSGVPSELMRIILKTPVPQACRLNPKIPISVQPILDRAMAKKPEDRYNNAQEMANEIIVVLTELGVWTPEPVYLPHVPAGATPIKEIGDFQIFRVIGSGRSGDVFEAKPRGQQRSVALRTPPEFLAKEQGFLNRFKREAETAIPIKHANLPQIYEAGAAGEQYYVALEYVWGRSLGEAVRQATKMAPPQALEIARQTAAALGAIHAAKMVHGRVTPRNILLNQYNHVKLMDFGIARPRRRDQDGDGTDLGVVDHLFYYPPERCLQQRTDFRADIYSLGVVLYEMLAGRVPFLVKSKWELLQMIIDSPPPSIRKYNPRVSEEVQSIIERALAKKPEQRFESAAEFAEKLEGALPKAAAPTA